MGDGDGREVVRKRRVVEVEGDDPEQDSRHRKSVRQVREKEKGRQAGKGAGQQTQQQSGQQTGQQRRDRGTGEDGWEWVVIDWMAGSQSLRCAVQEVNRKGRKQMGQGWKQIHYVGLDSQEWVYSAAQKKWVQNIQVDLMQIGEAELWELVQSTVQSRRGQKGRQLQLLLLGESPCCKTFSKRFSKCEQGAELQRASTPRQTPTGQTVSLRQGGRQQYTYRQTGW